MATRRGVRDRLASLTLRFEDEALERAYLEEYFRHHLANIRVAHLLGIALWVTFGLLVSRHLLFDRELDVTMRYGVFIPILLFGFGTTFLPGYRRFWQAEVVTVLLSSMVVWVAYVVQIRTMPPDYGYVGLILITAFSYTLVRLRFVVVLALTVVSFSTYLPVALAVGEIAGLKAVLAGFYLASFGMLGCITSYRLERFTRLLFVRERELDRERQRSESLLLNVLPAVIARRLMERDGDAPDEHLAERLDEVTVLFADAVGFTSQAGRVSPERLVDELDDLFSRFDALADRFGLEKIKTVGDAYMAVAGAPIPRHDHADAAAEMALAILEELEGNLWPTGEPVHVRIGIASGPAVAGVIGRRKFAYDLWGDTVNLASRLESHGEPGRILVSEGTAARLDDRFEVGPRVTVDLKGKGPTPARFLLGRARADRASSAGAQSVSG